MERKQRIRSILNSATGYGSSTNPDASRPIHSSSRRAGLYSSGKMGQSASKRSRSSSVKPNRGSFGRKFPNAPVISTRRSFPDVSLSKKVTETSIVSLQTRNITNSTSRRRSSSRKRVDESLVYNDTSPKTAKSRRSSVTFDLENTVVKTYKPSPRRLQADCQVNEKRNFLAFVIVFIGMIRRGPACCFF